MRKISLSFYYYFYILIVSLAFKVELSLQPFTIFFKTHSHTYMQADNKLIVNYSHGSF